MRALRPARRPHQIICARQEIFTPPHRSREPESSGLDPKIKILMNRLTQIDPATAAGKSKQPLDAVQSKLGHIPNLTRVLANAPATLGRYLQFSGPPTPLRATGSGFVATRGSRPSCCPSCAPTSGVSRRPERGQGFGAKIRFHGISDTATAPAAGPYASHPSKACEK